MFKAYFVKKICSLMTGRFSFFCNWFVQQQTTQKLKILNKNLQSQSFIECFNQYAYTEKNSFWST